MPLKFLVEFGLSEKEAIVYLALLGLGKAGASKIADTTQINRSTVYVILESLEEARLVTSAVKVNRSNETTLREFMASSPDALLATAKERIQREAAMKSKLESLVPALKALHKTEKNAPKVHLYEAVEHLPELLQEQETRGMKTYRFYSDIALLPEPGKVSEARDNQSAFAIYEDKIEFFSKNSFSLVIEQKEMADILKKIFDSAWKQN